MIFISFLFPPTIIESVPSKAFLGPPETGASIQAPPVLCLNFSENFIVSLTKVVDKSIIIVFSVAF